MPRRNEPSERTCIVTRATRPADELIRFVVSPDGAVVPDLKHRLPGRGAWVTRSRDAVEKAEKRKLFDRNFDGPVTAGPGLADLVERLLEDAAVGALALARKAGTLIGGFGKVEAALKSDAVVGLIHASEAGADGVSRLGAVARGRFGAGKPAVIRCFSGEQLDLAFGRTNVIHAALLAGPASDNVLARVGDLLGFRGDGERPEQDPAETPAPPETALSTP